MFKPLITIAAALVCASVLPAYAAPNVAPTVAITAPANASSVIGPATLTITATAADSDGSVTRVQFYADTTLLGTATTAPYSVTWSNVAVGNYSITARATDNKNASTTSAAVAINVNAAPTVSLTAPGNNAGYTAPATVTLAANAADADGTISKVEFFNGAILLGTATVAPYTATWANVAAGTYSLTATVTDDRGAQTTSTPLALRVNGLPVVTMTSPAANSIFSSPATIQLSAAASDGDGSISQVEFLNGTTVIGAATAAPYTLDWAGVPTGIYSITARATDNDGATATTGPLTVTVNAAPAVDLVAPTPGSTLIAPATVTLSATATDADGTVTKVDFFAGANFIASVTQAPYSTSWDNVPAGSYTITARATDNLGIATVSGAAAITVLPNTAPTVSLSASPTQATAPATITLTANASDSDGRIARVDFFQGTTLLGSATTAPYTVIWSNVAAGSYSVTAQATDDGGAVGQSGSVAVSVVVPPPGSGQLYFIEADHLNTPRLVTDPAGNVVWQWDHTDPFGHNVPVANAGFEFDLRFPGQVFDNETGLHYNYYRDYDPATGRYIESDPIGLEGGLNTYGYVGGNPITGFDFYGLLDGSGPNTTVQRLLNPAAAAETSSTVQRLLPIAARVAGAVAAVCTPGNTGQDKAACADDPGRQRSECQDPCDKEWQEARRVCRSLIYEQMQQRAGRRKKRSVTGVTGGYTDVEECARGLVSEQCGGNKISR